MNTYISFDDDLGNTVSLTVDLVKKVKEYQQRNNIIGFHEAGRKLIRIALEQEETKCS